MVIYSEPTLELRFHVGESIYIHSFIHSFRTQHHWFVFFSINYCFPINQTRYSDRHYFNPLAFNPINWAFLAALCERTVLEAGNVTDNECPPFPGQQVIAGSFPAGRSYLLSERIQSPFLDHYSSALPGTRSLLLDTHCVSFTLFYKCTSFLLRLATWFALFAAH